MQIVRDRRVWTWLPALLALGWMAGAAFGEPVDEARIDNSRFVYSTEEKLDFDLERHLASVAPHLLPYAETISHWTGYYTVSPRLVLALIEDRSGQVRDGSAVPETVNRPFGDLSEAATFPGQIEDVLGRLSALFYASPPGPDGLRAAPAATEAVRALLGSEADVAGLHSSFRTLFPGERPLAEPVPSARAADKATPPPGLLGLPFPAGESWFNGGAHTFNGRDPGPMSSLDFTRDLEPWGSNTSNTWVVAAHRGTAVIYSSCFVEVLGPNGWSTSYYHLDNVVVADGQAVRRDQRLSNYADNVAQAICDGGFSTTPHVHLSLRRNGQYVSLQDARLSGYRVQVGRFSYDVDCAFFWMERDGVRHCAWEERLANDIGGPMRPDAPRDLTVRTLSTSEIELRWTDRSSDETAFEIERRTAGGFSRIATAPEGATRWVDSGLAEATTYNYRVRAVNEAGASAYSNDAHATTFAEPGPCETTPETLCLNGGRFRVEVSWEDFVGGAGNGRVVPVSSPDSGLFWFFAEDNWEMLVKIIDGCGFNDRFWVFSAATTNVRYVLRVTDTVTGEVQEYVNPMGVAAPAIADTAAFASCLP